MRWKPVGASGHSFDVQFDRPRAARRRPEQWVLVLALAIPYGAVVFVLLKQDGWLSGFSTLLWLPFVFATAGYAWLTDRQRIRVDPAGVTVTNRFHRTRVRWSDIDDVALEGYPAVTLLARDRVVTCGGLRCAELAWLPLGRSERESQRRELDAVRDWLLAMRATALAMH